MSSSTNEQRLKEAFDASHKTWNKAHELLTKGKGDVASKKANMDRFAQKREKAGMQAKTFKKKLDKLDELKKEVYARLEIWMNCRAEEKKPVAIKQEDEDDSANIATTTPMSTMMTTTTASVAAVAHTTTSGTKRAATFSISPDTKDAAVGKSQKKKKSKSDTSSPLVPNKTAVMVAGGDVPADIAHVPPFAASTTGGTMVAAPATAVRPLSSNNQTKKMDSPHSTPVAHTSTKKKPPPASSSHTPSFQTSTKKKPAPASSRTPPPPHSTASAASAPPGGRVQTRAATLQNKQQLQPVADPLVPLPQHQVQSKQDWDGISSNMQMSDGRYAKLLGKIAKDTLELAPKFTPGIATMVDPSSKKGKIPSHIVLDSKWDTLPTSVGNDFVLDYYVHQDEKESGERLHDTSTGVPVFMCWEGGDSLLYYVGDWKIVAENYEPYGSMGRLQTNSKGDERMVCMKLGLKFEFLHSNFAKKIADSCHV